MTRNPKIRYPRIVAAFEKEASAGWDAVAEMAQTFDFPETGKLPHGEMAQLAADLKAKGVEKSDSTFERMVWASAMLHRTPKRSDWDLYRRSMAATTLGEFGRAGWEATAVVAAIKSSHARISGHMAEALVRPEPKESSEPDWEAELLQHGRALLRALTHLREHDFSDPMAELMYGLWQPRTIQVDWDAEFAALVEEG